MRLPAIVIAAFLWSASGAGAANDGTWCYRDFGSQQFINCSYYSVRQCLIAAGTLGGICERNQGLVQDAAPAKPGPSKKARR